MASIAERLAEARRYAGMTQNQLERTAGLGLNRVMRIERSIAEHPRSDTIIKLCVALGITSDFLLGLDDDFRLVEYSDETLDDA